MELGEAGVQLAQVILAGAPQRADAPDRGAPAAGPVLERPLDLKLRGVGELEAVGAEELDPVVLVGVVRGGDDRREVEAVAGDQQRRGGRGQHPAEQGVAAGGADSGGERRLEHLPGLAGVADYEHLGTLGLSERGGRATEAERELGGEQLSGDAPYAVGAKQLASHGEVVL